MLQPTPLRFLALSSKTSIGLVVTVLALSGCEVYGGGTLGRTPAPTTTRVVTSGPPTAYTPEYIPDSVEPGCGFVSQAGQCDGEMLRFCENGNTYSYYCPTWNLECGWDTSNDWYECLPYGSSAPPPVIPASGCSVGFEGTCSLDLLTYCQDDVDVMVDCADRGQVCDWIDDKGWYDCADPVVVTLPPPVDPVPAGCGFVTNEGYCEGDLLTYCDGGDIVAVDCAASGNMCTYDSANGYYNCLEPVIIDPGPDGCGDITYEGMCSYDELMWCEDGVIETSICDNGCGWNSEQGYYDCLPETVIDECDGVGYEGYCDGDRLVWCADGALESTMCDYMCGWDDANSYYNCL